jgi:hypothetical protein
MGRAVGNIAKSGCRVVKSSVHWSSFQCRAVSRVWTSRCEPVIAALRAAGRVMIGRLEGPSDRLRRRRKLGRLGRLGGGVPRLPRSPLKHHHRGRHAVLWADTLNRIAAAVEAVLTKFAAVSGPIS